MKTKTLEIVPTEEVMRMTRAFIKQEGTQKAAAEKIGIGSTMLSQVLAGKLFPGRKFPQFFGLKVVRVFVRDDKSQGK